MIGQGNLELALVMKKKERKIDKWLFIEHLVLVCAMNNNLGLSR